LSKYKARWQSCILRHCRQEMATSIAEHEGLTCRYIHPLGWIPWLGHQTVSSTWPLRSSRWNVILHYTPPRYRFSLPHSFLKRSIPCNQLQDMISNHYSSRASNHRKKSKNFLTFLQWNAKSQHWLPFPLHVLSSIARTPSDALYVRSGLLSGKLD
jgi:hypothetical protein